MAKSLQVLAKDLEDKRRECRSSLFQKLSTLAEETGSLEAFLEESATMLKTAESILERKGMDPDSAARRRHEDREAQARANLAEARKTIAVAKARQEIVAQAESRHPWLAYWREFIRGLAAKRAEATADGDDSDSESESVVDANLLSRFGFLLAEGVGKSLAESVVQIETELGDARKQQSRFAAAAKSRLEDPKSTSDQWEADRSAAERFEASADAYEALLDMLTELSEFAEELASYARVREDLENANLASAEAEESLHRALQAAGNLLRLRRQK